MAKVKVINERCPFGAGECERKKCEFIFHEAECDYYTGNQMPGREIADQVPKEATEFFEIGEDSEAKGELVYLDTKCLFPHPDNPRKDLGDLTELTDSIKASGVLQNLTVIPGHRMTKEEWIVMAKAEGVGKTDALGTYNPEEAYSPEGYTILIGHRRCAAAKEAGLKTVPCIVADMSIEEQIATMMAENMQRCDLTLYEQAEGFQMMMDLGISEEGISQKTGFSKTTVRRRLNLLKLDKEGFEKSQARGGSLSDYIELDKIKDEKEKNKVLQSVGTSSFKWDLKCALDRQKRKECEGKILELVRGFASERTEEISKQVATEFVRTISFAEGEIKNFTVPNDAESNQYYYEKNSFSIYLYKKKGEAEQKSFDERTEKEAQRQAKQNEWDNTCKEIGERAYNLRLEFVKNYVLRLKDIELVTLWAVKTLMDINYTSFDVDAFEMVTGFKPERDDETNYGSYFTSISEEKKKDELLFKCIYVMLEDDYYEDYFGYDIGEHCENEGLDKIYKFLCDFGYEMSDEEIALQDGTHSLFNE